MTKNKDESRFEKGSKMMDKVYAGMIPAGEEHNDRFMDLMVGHIFGELWDESKLSIPKRRLLTMGIVAAMGETGTMEIQCLAALKNKELSEEELREIANHAAPYAGYPRASGIKIAVEAAIAKHKKG